MANKPKPAVFSAREARQGWRGSPVLVVLIVSLILVAAVWLAAEIWGSVNEPNIPSLPSASAPADNNNPGASSGAGFSDNPPEGSRPATEGTDRQPVP
jgi:hypothetical protein